MPSLTGHVGNQLPACQMILDVTGDLFTHGRQLKQLVFNGRIIGLLGKLPILGRLVPQIVRPIHAAQSNELGRDCDRMVKTVRVRRIRQNNRLARKCDDFRDWHV